MDHLRIALLGNGASINVQNWANGLRLAGAEVEVITLHPLEEPLMSTSVITMRKTRGQLRYFAGVPAVRRRLAHLKPDIVIGYFATGYGTTAALCGWRPLVIVTAGSDIFVAPKRSVVLRWLLRWNFRRADLIIALAPHMAEAIGALGVEREKTFILPRGIDLERFVRADYAPPSAGEAINIVSTRSLQPIYNIDVLLNSLPLLSTIDYHLTVFGNGPLRAQLEQQSIRLDCYPHVSFAGEIKNSDLPAQMAKHNVFVSLTETEGVSASLLEAMALGMTPVVMDIPANRHWIKDGENGVLIHELSTTAIAEALRHVYGDLELRQRAYIQNPLIVRERADMKRNSSLYLDRFRALKETYDRAH